MINKHNLAVAAFASKEASRYTPNGILVTPDATVATDGFVLGWVSTPKIPVVNFPQVDGVKPEAMTDDFAPFILGLEAVKLVERALPKKTTIPALRCAAIAREDRVDVATGEITGERNAIVVTDLENPQVFRPAPVAGQFPNYAQVIPNAVPKFVITVNAELLARIATAFAKFGDPRSHAMRISFVDEMSAIRFDAAGGDDQGMTALLMPMRGGNEPIPHTYGWVAPVEVAKPEPSGNDDASAGANTPVDVAPVDVDMDASERGDASTDYIHVPDDAIPPRGE